MHTMSVDMDRTGNDSSKFSGSPELLLSLVKEFNSSMDNLSKLALFVDKVGHNGSGVVTNVHNNSTIRTLSGDEMEDIARRIRSIEGLLLDVPQ